MRRIALVAWLALIAGCGGAGASIVTTSPTVAPTLTLAPTPTTEPTQITHTLTGSFDLTGPVSFTEDDCFGTNGSGYDDVASGLQVVVKDGNGSVIATGALGKGVFKGEKEFSGQTEGDSYGDCIFPVAVYNVPEVPFYSVEVGHRGALTYSLADMQKSAFTVAFTLGSG